MIFHTKATQKNDSQKLTEISLNKDKSNELWSDLDETSQAAVSGGGDSVGDAYVNSFTYTVVNQGNYERGAGAIAFVSPKNLTVGLKE